MRYEGSSKHRDPWQPGRRGSLCPKDLDQAIVQQLLEASELVGNKRYAVYEGRAYCAQQHRADTWHGYPVGWGAVPETLRRNWRREGRLRRRDIKDHWD